MIVDIGEYVRVKGDPYPWKVVEFTINRKGSWYTIERKRKESEESIVNSLDDAFANLVDEVVEYGVKTQRVREESIRPFVTLKRHQHALIEVKVCVEEIQKSHLGDVPVHQYKGRDTSGNVVFFTEEQVIKGFEENEAVLFSYEAG